MPWLAVSFSERWVDWSYWQNDGSLLHRPFDVDAFCQAHPYVEGAILRAVWPNGNTDQHYAHYFDGFTQAGKKVAAYVWPNPQKSVPAQVDDWKRGLGDRVPKLIGQDYEDAATFVGATPTQLTSLMRACWEAAHAHFPQSAHINYSRGSWLSAKIIAGEWIHAIKWWMAHYISTHETQYIAAKHWTEIDVKLPISNNFTPGRGPVRVENVIGWQFSSSGQIVPKGTSDMDYMLRDFIGAIYGGIGPPPPPAIPVPVEIRAPTGKISVTVTEI